MLKAYKYRIYPNDGQKVQIAKHLDAVVLFTIRLYHIGKRLMSRIKNLSAKQTVTITVNRKLKKDYEWLKEVDKQVPSGKYDVSILVETEHMELPHTNQNTGIDLAIKNLCITSDGKKYENPKTIKKYEKKLVKLQRQLAYKEKRSQNYCKTRKKIALCHEKITNIRKDYLHKISHEIISENQVIVSESLQIRNMVKNHHLAKSISDVSWHELTRQVRV